MPEMAACHSLLLVLYNLRFFSHRYAVCSRWGSQDLPPPPAALLLAQNLHVCPQVCFVLVPTVSDERYDRTDKQVHCSRCHAQPNLFIVLLLTLGTTIVDGCWELLSYQPPSTTAPATRKQPRYLPALHVTSLRPFYTVLCSIMVRLASCSETEAAFSSPRLSRQSSWHAALLSTGPLQPTAYRPVALRSASAVPWVIC